MAPQQAEVYSTFDADVTLEQPKPRSKARVFAAILAAGVLAACVILFAGESAAVAEVAQVSDAAAGDWGGNYVKVTLTSSWNWSGNPTKRVFIMPCTMSTRVIIGADSTRHGVNSNCEAQDYCELQSSRHCGARVWTRDRCKSARGNFAWSAWTSNGNVQSGNYCKIKVEPQTLTSNCVQLEATSEGCEQKDKKGGACGDGRLTQPSTNPKTLLGHLKFGYNHGGKQSGYQQGGTRGIFIRRIRASDLASLDLKYYHYNSGFNNLKTYLNTMSYGGDIIAMATNDEPFDTWNNGGNGQYMYDLLDKHGMRGNLPVTPEYRGSYAGFGMVNCGIGYLGGYIYSSRSSANTACVNKGYRGLCKRAQVEGWERCAAGWTSDTKGYYMLVGRSGCGGGKGWRGWSGGTVGAYCCGQKNKGTQPSRRRLAETVEDNRSTTSPHCPDWTNGQYTSRYGTTARAYAKICKPRVCSCSHGTAKNSASCSGHGRHECASCHGGYYLSGSRCHKHTTCANHQHQTVAPTGTRNRSCAQNHCSCSHGAGKTGGSCTSHNAHSCKSCNGGYYLSGSRCHKHTTCAAHQHQTVAPTSTRNRSCAQNQCVCSSGTGATGTACKKHGSNTCKKCNGGHYLSGARCHAHTTCQNHQHQTVAPTGTRNRSCAQNVCSCTNGSGKTGTSCTSHNAHSCKSCKSGYYLSGARCHAHTKCTNHQHETQSATSTRNRKCAQNICKCHNGTPKTGGACTRHGANMCAGCSAGYYNAGGGGNGYKGCYTGHGGWKRPYGDVANSKAGALDCKAKCKKGGYKYFGLECPRATIHCQCQNSLTGSKIADQKCKEFNRNSGGHCKGPFQAGGYFFGAGSITSAYDTGASGDDDCKKKICKCTHGRGQSGTACSKNGNNECIKGSCKTGYHVDGNENCVQNVCKCSNGSAKIGPSRAGPTCTKHGANQCRKCNARFHLSGISCAQNQCVCSSGTAKKHPNCVSHGRNECARCNNGFHIEGLNCKLNKCTCKNGSPQSGIPCSKHKRNECAKCNKGYHMEGDNCVENKCTCKNGTGQKNIPCSKHKRNECARCNNGYHLKGDNCNENICVCKNGVGQTNIPCSKHGRNECSSCDFGYHHTGSEGPGSEHCKANVCKCRFGKFAQTAKTSKICTKLGANECNSCQPGYHMEGKRQGANCRKYRGSLHAFCGDKPMAKWTENKSKTSCENSWLKGPNRHKCNNVRIYSCVENLCTCQNGKPSKNTDCPNHGKPKCKKNACDNPKGPAIYRWEPHKCLRDTDGDGAVDIRDICHTDPRKKNKAGECGCNKIDRDATGAYNCAVAAFVGISGKSPFYNVVTKKGGGKTFKLASHHGSWNVSPNYFAKGDTKRVRSSVKGKGTFRSANFYVNENTFAFDAAGGCPGTSITAKVFSPNGWKVARNYAKPTKGPFATIFWDMSPWKGQKVHIQVTDNSDKCGVYFNNLRIFNQAQSGCIPSCLSIEKKGRGYKILGDNNLYVKVGSGSQYCRSGAKFPGMNGGSSLVSKTAFSAAHVLSKAAFHATPNLPACFNLEQMDPKKTAIGETAYLVSVQDGKTRFYFSNKNTLAPTDKKFFCVYKTKKPRCHALVGALRAMKPVRMKCKAERNRNAMCFDTIFNEQCTMDGTSICGNKKMTRDMLECCDKTSDDFGGNGCLTRRRRLNENLVITNKWKVDAIAGPKCAQRCVDRTGCRAFRLDAANRCELAIDCKASAGPLDGLYASREWMLLPGTQPYPPSRKRKRKSKK